MILKQFSLAGKVAVVVGGTSGIGRALSLGLSDAGADVLATSRNKDKVADTTNLIQGAGRRTFPFCTDATDEKQVEELCRAAVDYYGKVDILVNAAGINIRGSLSDLSYTDWRNVLKANLDSVFLCSKYFSRQMMANRSGKIINIGSLNSVVAMSNLSAYAASKGGVVQLTKAMAVELSKYQINVNAILPGYFKTEMTEGLMNDPELLARIQTRTPMGRIGHVDELVGTAVFLSSQAASFITGTTIAVDGGFLSFGVDLAHSET